MTEKKVWFSRFILTLHNILPKYQREADNDKTCNCEAVQIRLEGNPGREVKGHFMRLHVYEVHCLIEYSFPARRSSVN